MALDRSRFLHRLRLIGVDWGSPADAARSGQGTFWEDWRIAWRPEFAVDLIAASGYGTTVAQAATAKVAERSRMSKTTLPDLTGLVQQVLLADLPEALPVVLSAVADQVALDSEVVHLMDALPALARTMRYGDVRGTDVSAVRSIAHGLVVRICVGLPAAVGALDDAAAALMRNHLNAVDGALALLDDASLTEEWRQTQQRVVARDDLHGLLAGRLTRLLYDAGRMDAPSVENAMGLVLTIGVPPARAASWIEGFLADGGVLLVHDDRLLSLVDRWLSGIPGDTFVEVLPLLRRTFGEFAVPERQAIGERARRRVRGDGGRPAAEALDLDLERAERVLPTLRLLLGRDVDIPRHSWGAVMTERDSSPAELTEDERLRRWRLVLGGGQDGTGVSLNRSDAGVDAALAALYDSERRGETGERRGGLGASAPSVARWLGDIRSYFPSTVVQVMQADAIERLNLTRLLLEPEMLEAVEPDVHLVGTLLSLNRVMPAATKQAARAVVRKVVSDLERRIAQKTKTALTGALNRAARINRPRHRDIDWQRTIHANLKHYQPSQRTVVPDRLIGYGRRTTAVQRDVVLCVDQSGSMAASVVYSGVFSAVLATMRSLRTSLVVFDTAVADLTDELHDPVEVLFGTQLGGGTDINRAISYSQGLITRPRDTVFVLISDLYEGGVRDEMLRRVAAMLAAGVQVIVLLALSDEGAPAHDHENAAALAAMGVPAFACTPDAFPDLMAAAIQRQDLRGVIDRLTG